MLQHTCRLTRGALTLGNVGLCAVAVMLVGARVDGAFLIKDQFVVATHSGAGTAPIYPIRVARLAANPLASGPEFAIGFERFSYDAAGGSNLTVFDGSVWTQDAQRFATTREKGVPSMTFDPANGEVVALWNGVTASTITPGVSRRTTASTWTNFGPEPAGTSIGGRFDFDPSVNGDIAGVGLTNSTATLALYDGSTWQTGIDFSGALTFTTSGGGTGSHYDMQYRPTPGGSRLAIAYKGGTHPGGILRYAEHDGSGDYSAAHWSDMPIQAGYNQWNGVAPSLAFVNRDGAYMPAIASFHADTAVASIAYAEYNGSAWSYTYVDKGSTSLALAVQPFTQQPMIAYYNPTAQEVRMAEYDGSDWLITTLATLNPGDAGFISVSIVNGLEGNMGVMWTRGHQIGNATHNAAYLEFMVLEALWAPEPGTLALLLAGLAGLCVRRRRSCARP